MTNYTTKALALAWFITVVASAGAVSVLAAFFTNNQIPSGCTGIGYGYQAWYGYGYSNYSCPTLPTVWWGGGGGGWSSSLPVSPTTTWTTATWVTTTPTPTGVTVSTPSGSFTCSIANSRFDTEQNSAYLFACTNNITTFRAIENSMVDGMLYRRDMAKMMSNFAMNFLGKKPDMSKSCEFDDLANQDAEMKYYIKTACQLWLMGYKGDGVTQATTFSPDEIVNRAQFGTVLSRLLYGTMYNTDVSSPTWYARHLAALNSANIIKMINMPMMQERRGFVWIMLSRITKPVVSTMTWSMMTWSTMTWTMMTGSTMTWTMMTWTMMTWWTGAR